METALIWVGLLLAPAAFLYLLLALLAHGPRLIGLVRRRRGNRAASRSLEQLVADLRRLETAQQRVEAVDATARAHRLHAISLAYDDTLAACCVALGLPAPSDRPLSPIDRLATEADLAQHGLTW
ncbi:MAG: hypothetical protein ACRDPG_07460 [Nocardioidaceae bacterium]